MEEAGLTNQLTSGEKKSRDWVLLPITQPIWWSALPVRWFISWAAGLMFGQEIRRFLYQKILTPANMLTGARVALLIKAVFMFFEDAALARQVEILFVAITTDFFDGPLARNNNEVTELGTYMDHIGDWAVITWVMFLTLWHGPFLLPAILYIMALAIIPILFAIYAARFKKCYDHAASLTDNISGFATEELQTDWWGRIQFVALCIAIFGTLFESAAFDQSFILNGFINAIPHESLISIIAGAFGVFLILGGYNIRDAIDYSETQVKKFRERMRKIKSGSPR
ncbi:MAG: CDP-alcohol phosphatidyltransferase family protein [Candidatus Sungbacteria bacterium]|nr:CDP-alcohol phosphatidyltransferase family protein [Candidatus Sungbacteria bacterium]